MAIADRNRCIDRILQHEGSKYTDGIHPYDPGGPTKYGIILADVRMFMNPKATAYDVQQLTRANAIDIYTSKYFVAVNFDKLPAGPDDTVADYAVNSGWVRAGKVLRRVLGQPDNDWHVTDQVLDALSKRNPDAVVDAICDERLKFLRTLKIWPTYGNGWTTRVGEVRTYSHQLAANKTNVVPFGTFTEANTAKGHVNPPAAAKAAVITGGVATATGSASILTWAQMHPALAAGAIAGVSLAVGGALYMLNKNHQARQEAPTPGTAVVPIAA